MKRIAALFFLFLLIGGTSFVLSRNKFYICEGEIFGTTYHIKYSATQDLSHEITQELQAVDLALSMFKEESTLSKFNRNEAFSSDQRFDAVVRLALQISQETHGAFDITVAPLVNAWGFGFQNKTQITNTKIDSILQFVGYEKLELHKGSLQKKDQRCHIDAGAIAKGYAVDRVAQVLSQHAAHNYMVEIGGEVAVRGKNEKNENWTIGINKAQDTQGASQALQAIITLTDKAVATSGNYRNFYYENGKKYAHTIHPKTGRPVTHSLLSATVVAPTCAQADAYATALMVMGPEAAKKFVQQHSAIDAFLIYNDTKGTYQTWTSLGMKKLIVNTDGRK